MSITWTDLDALATVELPVYIGEPPFTVDGQWSSSVSPDLTTLDLVREQFRGIDWSVIGEQLLTTVIEAGPLGYPLIIGAATTTRLRRVWISNPGFVFTTAEDTRVETENLTRALLVMLRRHFPESLWKPGVAGPSPYLMASYRPNAPWPVDAKGSEAPAVPHTPVPTTAAGVRVVVDHASNNENIVVWSAYALAQSMHDFHRLYELDPARFTRTFGALRPPLPQDVGQLSWPADLQSFTEPTDTYQDLSFLAYEGGIRTQSATDEEIRDGERLLREVAAQSGERAGSAINTLVFSCLDTKKQRIEALCLLLKSALDEHSFESWNSISNMSSLLLDEEAIHSGAPLAQLIFELDDLRLDSEAAFLLGRTANNLGLPSIARHYFTIGMSRNPHNYEERLSEALRALPAEDSESTVQGFRTLVEQRLREISVERASQVARLIDLLSVNPDSSKRSKTSSHVFMTLARKAQEERNAPAEAAWLALCALEADPDQASAAYFDLVNLSKWRVHEAQVLLAAIHLTTPFPISQRSWIEIARVAAALDLDDAASDAVAAALHPETPLSDISLALAIEATQIAASVSTDEASRESLLAVLRNSPHREASLAYLRLTHDESALAQAILADDLVLAEAAAANPYVNYSNQPNFWVTVSSDLAWIAASESTARPESLQQLSLHEAESVRRAAARNANTPADSLLMLASDSSWTVREAVLANPSASDEARAAASLFNS